MAHGPHRPNVLEKSSFHTKAIAYRYIEMLSRFHFLNIQISVIS